MTNHVHLLLTPGRPDGASLLMKHLGQRYVQYVNRVYDRSGTLWEGRFRSSIVQAETYLLRCQRYIELNPVRAGMVKAPEQYKWSSAKEHLAPVGSSLIVDHAVYVRLGATPLARARGYGALMKEPLEEGALSQIRIASRQGGVLGSDQFKDQIETQLGRRVRLRKPGRKPKQLDAPGAGHALSPVARVGAPPLVFALLSPTPLLSPEARTIRRG